MVPVGFGQAFDDGYDRRILAVSEPVVCVHAKGLQVGPPLALRFDDFPHDADGRILGRDDKLFHFVGDGEETDLMVVRHISDHCRGFVTDVADDQTDG